MELIHHYIDLSWTVVGICENARQPLLSCIPGIDNDEAAAVEHYVIGYMAFWHIAFAVVVGFTSYLTPLAKAPYVYAFQVKNPTQ